MFFDEFQQSRLQPAFVLRRPFKADMSTIGHDAFCTQEEVLQKLFALLSFLCQVKDEGTFSNKSEQSGRQEIWPARTRRSPLIASSSST